MYRVLVRKTPPLVLVFTAMAILGAFFPVYGVSFGAFKLTMFRMGVFPLLATQLGMLYRFRKRTVITILAFIVLRFLSLLWADNFSYGFSQIVWFFEGSCLLIGVNAAGNRYIDYVDQFKRLAFLIGGVSIFFIFLQAVLYFGAGYKFYVPFTQGIPEIATNEFLWNYPIYGAGRIVGSFYEPNMAGSMCAYYFALILPFLADANFKYKKLVFIPILIILMASLFTGSRQSAVCIALVFIIYSVFFSEHKTKLLATILVISILVAIVVVYYWNSIGPVLEESENVFSRFDSGSGGANERDFSGGRFSFIQDVWRKFGWSNVILGAGEGASHGGGHNVFLAVFIENGIITFCLFIYMLSLFMRMALRCYRRNPEPLNLSSFFLVISWVFLMMVNWAQLNQSLSFVFLSFGFLSSSVFKGTPVSGISKSTPTVTYGKNCFILLQR